MVVVVVAVSGGLTVGVEEASGSPTDTTSVLSLSLPSLPVFSPPENSMPEIQMGSAAARNEGAEPGPSASHSNVHVFRSAFIRSFPFILLGFWKREKTKQVSGRLLSKMCNKLFTRTCLFKYHNDCIHMNNTRDTSSNFLQFNQMTFLPMCSFLCYDRLTECVRFHFFSFL